VVWALTESQLLILPRFDHVASVAINKSEIIGVSVSNPSVWWSRRRRQPAPMTSPWPSAAWSSFTVKMR
jgi:hypothetical protein